MNVKNITNDQVKLVLTIAAVLIVLSTIVAAFVYVPDRPILQIAVLRKCDFITISEATSAVCGDGTMWQAEPIGTVPEPTAEPTPEPVAAVLNVVEQAIAAGAVQSVVAAPAEEEAATVPPAAPPPATDTIQARYSFYWPPLGGVNCATFVNGLCISKMASGKLWADHVGTAVACPSAWAFGTTVELDGRVWVCEDRGGKIVFDVNGLPWIDFLTATAAYPYGSIVTVRVTHP